MPTYLAYDNGLEVLWGTVECEPTRARGVRVVVAAGCGNDGRKREVGFVVSSVTEMGEADAEDAHGASLQVSAAGLWVGGV